jgi:hypothetical protein
MEVFEMVTSTVPLSITSYSYSASAPYGARAWRKGGKPSFSVVLVVVAAGDDLQSTSGVVK